VLLAKWYERTLGRSAWSHFTVTKGMSDFLYNEWHLSSRPIVLYDRAPSKFRRLQVEEVHSLFVRLSQSDPTLFKDFAGETPEPARGERTLFTEVLDTGEVVLRENRPALLISSTSWTPDENFGLLLDAMVGYEAEAKRAAAAGKRATRLLLIITGKGPEKAFYEAKIKELDLQFVRIGTMWLKAEDYPLLLGAADLGVCLHTSSSGLDLPMKVVDMFGCGLPVCAVGFKCLPELVRHNENGLVFKTSQELLAQVQQLFAGFPQTSSQLDKLRQGVEEFQAVRWEQNWNELAHPAFYP